jgi:TonB-dependent receptor
MNIKKGKTVNKYLLSLMVLLPLTTSIYAQDAVDEEMEEVVTTGIKSSLKDAIDIKRKNVGIVDAITAEDLGKFPDGNLAEALSRMVGVTTDRSNDEGTTVNVRGLGPEFNLVTLNGRTMPTIPPQYGGGRSFNFGDISSHGVSAVEVYKSANAVLPSGGLGSTINMVTAKPLMANKGGAVSVRGVHNTKNVNGDHLTPELEFIYSTKGAWDNGGWGFALSGSHQKRDNREEGTNEITWLPSSVVSSRVSSAAITSNNKRSDGAYWYPESLAYKYKDNSSVRDNLQTTFQMQLGRLTTTIDYTVSSTSFEFTGITTGSYFGGWNTTAATINERGVVISGTSNAGADGDSWQNDFEYGESDNNNKSLGINFDFQVNDNLNLSLDHHDSSAGFKGTPGGTQNNILQFSNGAWQGWGWWPVQEAAGYLRARSFDFNNQVGSLSWAMDKSFQGANTGATEFDGSDMGPRQAFLNYQDRKSNLQQTQFIGTWDNNDGLAIEALSSVDFGMSQMETEFVNQKWFNQLVNGKIADGNPIMMTYAFMPDDVWTKVSTPGYLGSDAPFYYLNISKEDALFWFGAAGMVGDFSGSDGSWWNNSNSPYQWPAECLANDAVDANGNNIGLGTNVGYDGNRSSTRGVVDGCYGSRDSNGLIREELNSAFVNFNFDWETATGQPVRAQLGLRYEEEERTSTASTTVPTNTAWSLGAFMYGDKVGVVTAPQVYTGAGNSDYLLPNFNLTFEFKENQVIKLALSKTIARPSLEQMDQTVSVGAFDARYPLTLGTGNPDLEPYASTNFDLAYEYYYAEGSYLAVNYFSKEISDYHGAGLVSGSFNGVRDVTAGPRGALIVPENDDALCQWTASQGYWACGWSNAYDWAWLNNTGFTFGCNGASSTDCIADANNGNAVFLGNAADPLYMFNLAKPVNKYSGDLRGVELAIQHLFENNFGFVANMTLINGDTNVQRDQLGEQFALPGFGDASNFSVFYEDDKLSARLSYNLKAETYAGMDQYNPLFIKERAQVDFNANYNVTDNVVVFFEAINITDSEVELFARYEEMTFLYQDHGPVYKAGFRYKF